MIRDPDRLYDLLPAMYRESDAEQGLPLRALLRIVGTQVDAVEESIERLYDDLFIETCQPWVVPYIGDLVGNRLLYDQERLAARGKADELFPDLTGPDLRAPVAIRTRADVAKTIYFRRRKGTLPMLEELARDVTGWPAHAVEFFELLGWTQHREHFRPQARWTDVRRVDAMERIEGPFDEASHTVDVRRITPREGWHGIPNIGFFVFRLGSYELGPVPARSAGADWRWHFSPTGNPAPLFTRWRREGDEAGLATELHVATPIRRGFFYEDLVRYRDAVPTRPEHTDLYGMPEPVSPAVEASPEASFFIFRNGVPITPAVDPTVPGPALQPQIVCRQLDAWPAAQPVGRIIAVDPRTGRMVVGDGWGDATETIDVYYHYGFPADLGGGPYERGRWLVKPSANVTRLFVREGIAAGTPDTYPSVADALNEWAAVRGRPNAVITILDSRTYPLPASIVLRNEGFLAIEAADGERPLLRTAAAGLVVDALPPVVAGDPDRRASLTLGGVVVEGHLHAQGDLGRLRLLHCTLLPGRRLTEDGDPEGTNPSLVVDAGPPATPRNVQLRVEIAFSILGPMVIPQHAHGVWLLDSIVDGFADASTALGGGAADAPGPPLHAERSTVFGRLRIRTLHLSESIVTGDIRTARTQAGCCRFSWVRTGSRTPRRYRCQPELAAGAAVERALEQNPLLTQAERDAVRAGVQGWLVPAFSARRYGRPAYAQLRHAAPREIRTGAEDGAEMGVYCHLKQPQRESNLRLRLEEYLPFGLEAAVLYAT
jgi:hypothetical protein